MSIVLAKTNKYGPATLDIQIEQGGDFILPISLTQGILPWNLTGATFDQHFSSSWYPPVLRYNLVFTPTILTAGTGTITFPSASSLGLPLPNSPRKSVSPRVFELGGWVFKVTQLGITTVICEGKVYLDRDPCLM